MSFEIDRDSNHEPSLKEMTQKALMLLDAKVEGTSPADVPGYFLMVEGSRIDMAAHKYFFSLGDASKPASMFIQGDSNDPAAHARDILHYHEVIGVLREYIDTHPGTLLISVSLSFLSFFRKGFGGLTVD